MSKLSKAVADYKVENDLIDKGVVTNFMAGNSYRVNPLDTLKMVTASSIYGEPAYYRTNNKGSRGVKYSVDSLVNDTILDLDVYKGKTTEQVMELVIDNALAFDFEGTLRWACTLRKEFNMRLNPQIIMVRAAEHPARVEFTKNNPGLFDTLNQIVMSRPDEPMSQMAYYMYLNKGRKNNMPSILKRSWAKKLSNLTRYNVHKYKNHEIGMINAVRISHANADVLDELMKNGTVEVAEDAMTWENLRSSGKSWKEIFETIDMGHMALLRNLRGVFAEVEDIEFCKRYLAKLKDGVVNGKQFPFRYYSALQAVKKDRNVNHIAVVMDTLEECIDISLENFPKLRGKTICLSDNSGSAWGAFNSEFGSVTVAEIDNLSSVITAACSDEGYVGKFGDKLIVHPISKRQGVLAQAEKITHNQCQDVGGGTEGGIWEFFKKAIENKEHWDNIFIYSDQQAGHGGLYGTCSQHVEYSKGKYNVFGQYIDVYKLVKEYRAKVNPKVNVFSVQTAGYDNVVIPEMTYRTAIQYGWTGKEAVFAEEYIRQWNDIESRENN